MTGHPGPAVVALQIDVMTALSLSLDLFVRFTMPIRLKDNW